MDFQNNENVVRGMEGGKSFFMSRRAALRKLDANETYPVKLKQKHLLFLNF